MRKAVLAVAFVVLANAVPAVASSAINTSAVSPERMAALREFLTQDCGSCHGLTRKGGLGSPLTPEALAGRSDEDLALTILHGVPGTPMPSWSPLLTEAEVDAIVRMLREGE